MFSIFSFVRGVRLFWTVGDVGPYKHSTLFTFPFSPLDKSSPLRYNNKTAPPNGRAVCCRKVLP